MIARVIGRREIKSGERTRRDRPTAISPECSTGISPYPLHALIFSDLARAIAREAEKVVARRSMSVYFVGTALTTVRPVSQWTRVINVAALMVARAAPNRRQSRPTTGRRQFGHRG